MVFLHGLLTERQEISKQYACEAHEVNYIIAFGLGNHNKSVLKDFTHYCRHTFSHPRRTRLEIELEVAACRSDIE